jgi:hypothetical protein
MFKHKFMRALLGAVAIAALTLAISAPGAPAAHADPSGVYPIQIYGPGGQGLDMSGTWNDGGGVGLLGQEVWSSSNGPFATASWQATGLDPNTFYDVCAYIPNNNADANARYSVIDGHGAEPTVTIAQSQYTNQWAFVGEYQPFSDGIIDVILTNVNNDGANATVVGADAMMFINLANDTVVAFPPGQASCIPNGG